jgi:hypothetical protein
MSKYSRWAEHEAAHGRRANFENTPIIMVTSIFNTDYLALFPTDEHSYFGVLTKPMRPLS